uniref:Uncharacterized protein n=1 Tax=Haemonchus contortus TaxID=6289 RepID=A0A7I5E8A5_HAECO|nr:Protein Y39F10A.1 [Haemonchus contortus]
MALIQLVLAVLQLAPSVLSFDAHTPSALNSVEEPKKCFTCSVFTFIDNRLLCTNPGTCYSDYCYSYVLSDLRSMFLSGCAEDWSDFEFRKGEDDRILCHAHGHFGLCLCRAGGESPCNKRYTNDTELQWVNSDLIIMNSVSHKVTGFTADYARNRVLQMRVEGFPEKFPGSPLNTARFSLTSLPIVLSFVIISFLQ